MKLIRSAILFFGLNLFSILAVSCNLPAQGSGPHAWIDAPLNGTVLPVNTKVDIISHSNDLAGITNVELSINDVTLRTDAVPESGQVYVLMSQAWTPTEAGSYQLRVRAQTGNGGWSDYAVVTVTVEREPTFTATLPESPTPFVTLTPSLTATLTESPTPLATLTPGFTSTPAIPSFTLLENAFCRTGPDISFPDVTAIPKGDRVEIKGVSEDGFWYFVFWKQFNSRCWVAAHAGQTGGDLTGVSVMVSPPTPSPTSIVRKP